MEKRTNRELNLFYKHFLFYMSYTIQEIYRNTEKQKETIKDRQKEFLVSKNNHEEIIIKVPQAYPFKAPSVDILINGKTINYIEWCVSETNNLNKQIDEKDLTSQDILLYWFFIINKNYKILNEMPQFSIDKKQDCLCCKSIICSDNWSPSKKLTDIIIEILLRKSFLKSINVHKKYLNSIFFNERWNLNIDIILEILKQLFKRDLDQS